MSGVTSGMNSNTPGSLTLYQFILMTRRSTRHGRCGVSSCRYVVVIVAVFLTLTMFALLVQVALLLLPQQGVPEDMIVGDFYARHTTTNLRNVSISRRNSTTLSRPRQYPHSHLLTALQVGRFMLAYNLTRGIITTNYMQVSDGLHKLICWQTNRICDLFANDLCHRFTVLFITITTTIMIASS